MREKFGWHWKNVEGVQINLQIFTDRICSMREVMFSQASVILSSIGGVSAYPPLQADPLVCNPPPRSLVGRPPWEVDPQYGNTVNAW